MGLILSFKLLSLPSAQVVVGVTIQCPVCKSKSPPIYMAEDDWTKHYKGILNNGSTLYCERCGTPQAVTAVSYPVINTAELSV